jgi:hypothetical protein
MSADERGRLHAPGHRVEDGSRVTLLITQHTNGCWVIHGPDGPWLRLDAATMIAVAESILKRARGSAAVPS